MPYGHLAEFSSSTKPIIFGIKRTVLVPGVCPCIRIKSMMHYVHTGEVVVTSITSNSSSKTRGAAAPRTRITCAYFLGSEEPSLKLLRSAKLQGTNSSPNSNCRRSKSAIFISRNINSNINSLLRLRVGTHIIYIYIYISIYISDERYIPEVEMKTI